MSCAGCIQPLKRASLPDANPATRGEAAAANRLVKQFNERLRVFKSRCPQQ
jgi:hypothetical protein